MHLLRRRRRRLEKISIFSHFQPIYFVNFGYFLMGGKDFDGGASYKGKKLMGGPRPPYLAAPGYDLPFP